MSRAEGDREFAEFVAVRSPRLLLLAQHLWGDDPAAEDMTQTVLERVCLRWDRVARTTDPYPYARRMLMNLGSDKPRRPPEEASPSDSAAQDELISSTARHLASDDLALLKDRIALRRALADLTPRDRAIVVLRYLEDLPEDEVAGELGIKRARVERVCRRALTAFQDASRRASEEEE